MRRVLIAIIAALACSAMSARAQTAPTNTSTIRQVFRCVDTATGLFYTCPGAAANQDAYTQLGNAVLTTQPMSALQSTVATHTQQIGANATALAAITPLAQGALPASMLDAASGAAKLDAQKRLNYAVIGDLSAGTVTSGRTAAALSALVDQHTALIAAKAAQTDLATEATTARAGEQAASAAAAAAQTTANAAVPAAKIGVANGVAGLNTSGQVTAPSVGDVSAAAVTPAGGSATTVAAAIAANATATSNAQTTANAAIPSVKIGIANGVAGLNASGQLTAASIGDISSATVNLGTSRTQSAMADDVLNVLNHGAKGDGATNDASVVYNLQLIAQGKNGGIIYLPSSHKYVVGSYQYASNGVFFEMGANTSIVDTSGNIAGNIAGLVDSSISHNGKTFFGTDNGKYNMSAQQTSMLWLDDSQTTQGWQKNAYYTRDDCGAASAYTTGTLTDSVLAAKDCVGYESQVRTSGSVKTARLYAHHMDDYIFPGSDAWAIAVEPEIYNYGSDQPQTGKATTKMVMHPGCYGTYACTASIEIAGMQHVGLLSAQDQFLPGGWMWAMWPHLYSDVTTDPVAGVRQDGVLIATGVTSTDSLFASVNNTAVSGIAPPRTRGASINNSGTIGGTTVNTATITNTTSGIASLTLVSGGALNAAGQINIAAPVSGGSAATATITGYAMAGTHNAYISGSPVDGTTYTVPGGTCTTQPQLKWSASKWAFTVAVAGACTVPPGALTSGSTLTTVTLNNADGSASSIVVEPLYTITGVSLTSAGSGYNSAIAPDVTVSPVYSSSAWQGAVYTPAKLKATTGASPISLPVALGDATAATVTISNQLNFGSPSMFVQSDGTAVLKTVSANSASAGFVRAYGCSGTANSSAFLSWNCSGAAGEADVVVSGDAGSTRGFSVYQFNAANTNKTRIWGVASNGVVTQTTITVANLPTTCTAGQTVFVSDARNTGEAAGAGTGAPVYCTTAGKWFANGAAVTQ